MALLDREQGKLVEWRYSQLLRAGVEKEDAIALAQLVDLDLHALLDLLAAGCPLATAIEILL